MAKRFRLYKSLDEWQGITPALHTATKKLSLSPGKGATVKKVTFALEILDNLGYPSASTAFLYRVQIVAGKSETFLELGHHRIIAEINANVGVANPSSTTLATKSFVGDQVILINRPIVEEDVTMLLYMNKGNASFKARLLALINFTEVAVSNQQKAMYLLGAQDSGSSSDGFKYGT